MKEVVAITLGVYKDSRRRPGTTFWVEDDETADWYEPVGEPAPKTAPASEEMTFAEAGQRNAIPLREALGRKRKN